MTKKLSPHGLSVIRLLEEPFDGFEYHYARVGVNEDGGIACSYTMTFGELTEENRERFELVISQVLCDVVTEEDEDAG